MFFFKKKEEIENLFPVNFQFGQLPSCEWTDKATKKKIDIFELTIKNNNFIFFSKKKFNFVIVVMLFLWINAYFYSEKKILQMTNPSSENNGKKKIEIEREHNLNNRIKMIRQRRQ